MPVSATPARYVRLALSGVRGSPLRSSLTALAVALAVALFLGALGLHDGYALALAGTVERLGYDVLVTAKGCPYETATLVLRGGNIPMYVNEALVDQLEDDPDVVKGTRFLMQAIESGPGGTFTIFMGIDDVFRELKPWMTLQQGEWFSGPLQAEAIVGYNVAEILRVKAGDTIDIASWDRPLTVRGVFDRSGSQDDGMIFLPLAFAQKLFDLRDRLTGVGVRLTDPDRIGPFLDRVFEIPSMQAITVSQVRGTILDLLSTARALMLASTLVAMVIASLGVFNAVLVSVSERRRELGIMKVIGASSGQVLTLVAAETMMIGLAGGVAGWILALAGAAMADDFVLRLLPWAPAPAAGHLVVIAPGNALFGIGCAVVVALLAGLIPAARASWLPAVASLRGGE